MSFVGLRVHDSGDRGRGGVARKRWKSTEGRKKDNTACDTADASTYPTSYEGLVGRANTQPGEWVLVHAAAGGVGLAACQIAKGE